MPEDARRIRASHAGRVLVVDDERDMRYLTRAFLEHAFPGIEVVEAEDGSEGLRLLAGSAFDAIVSDHRMPGMDGFAFLTLATQSVPAAHCILMTAYADKALQDRAQAAGLAFIEKAGDPENVVAAVAAILRPRAPVAR